MLYVEAEFCSKRDKFVKCALERQSFVAEGLNVL